VKKEASRVRLKLEANIEKADAGIIIRMLVLFFLVLIKKMFFLSTQIKCGRNSP